MNELNQTKINAAIAFHEKVKKELNSFIKEEQGLIGPIRAVEMYEPTTEDIVKNWNYIGDYLSETFDMRRYKERSTPIGYMAAWKDPETGNIGTGYSYTNVEDACNFSKDLGIHLAIQRAKQNANKSIANQTNNIFNKRLFENMKFTEAYFNVVREFPIPVASQVDHFAKRCTAFFKTPVVG